MQELYISLSFHEVPDEEIFSENKDLKVTKICQNTVSRKCIKVH